MQTGSLKSIWRAVAALMICVSGAWAARGKPAPQPPLTEEGQRLEAGYAKRLESLKTDIAKQLPDLDEKKIAVFFAAREAEMASEEAVQVAKKEYGAVARGQGLVNHAKGKWIGGAEAGIAKTKAKLAEAKTDTERDALQKELAGWEKNKQDGLDALKERQAILDKAMADQPRVIMKLETAEAALAKAQAATLVALDALNAKPVLKSDKLDEELVTFEVLYQGTPYGLASFAQQGKQQAALLNSLLANPDLMFQMAVADGPSGNKYGQAMEIYTSIQKATKNAADGTLQRLALAVSLEHAKPIRQRSATANTDAPDYVDPVKRYLSYEKAFLNGELDPGFGDLSVWDYRMVVDGEEPDEISAWGRQMVHNYRPDHISTSDYRWRYVAAVRTEIRYGSQCNKYDKPELQFFQNILMNGGVCGRRAFFGRFILRAFGVPTTARPQPGHAALAHWTPDGWVVCLGGGWGAGTTKLRYKKDLDFLASTQARAVKDAYPQVKRAQWMGDVCGEAPVYGLHATKPELWYAISLYVQREIIRKAKAVAMAAVGEELGEANESHVKYEVAVATMTAEDRKITVGEDGVITIPAAACSSPTKSTGKIVFMPSDLGGKQLHYSRTGKGEPFEYTFDAPTGGSYALSARVVTPSWKQILTVTVNGAKEPTDIALPFTVGMWDTTDPVEITLKKGKNVLTFTRDHEWLKGLTIRDFTLTPVK